MADITGPISTLPGAIHEVPRSMKCDQHDNRKAVVRVQGETDSFGCEMIDMCQECFDAHKEWKNSPEAAEHRKGVCEWCKNPADDLRDRRDFEEGMSGQIYLVCGECVKKENESLAAEYEDSYNDYDDDDEYDDPHAWEDDEFDREDDKC